MNFIFEGRKNSGPMMSETPSVAAVRITRHREGRDQPDRVRLYVCLSPAAIKVSRWIKGDKIVAGLDEKNKLIAFKRDPENGYTLAIGGRGNASFQMAVSTGSAMWHACNGLLGVWIPVSEAGLLLVGKLDSVTQPQR